MYRKFNPNSLGIPKELCYLTGEYRENIYTPYEDLSGICSSKSFYTMADIIMDTNGISEFAFETIHNYIEHDTNMVRKGAALQKSNVA